MFIEAVSSNRYKFSVSEASLKDKPATIRLSMEMLGISDLSEVKMYHDEDLVYANGAIILGYEFLFSDEPSIVNEQLIAPVTQFDEWEFQKEGVSSGTIVSAPGFGIYLVLAVFAVALAFLVVVKMRKRL